MARQDLNYSLASVTSLAGSYESHASNLLMDPSMINVEGSEDVIVIGKTIEEPETPLNPDYESRHSRSSLTELQIPPKDRWANKCEFLLSSLSMFLGLGSVWRFPFTVYENGGGAFLVPYLIFLFAVAKPLTVVDLTLGQFSGRGPWAIWDVVPILRGVAVTTIIIAATTCTYLCGILSFCVDYMYRGLESNLPWKECNPSLYVKRSFIENLTCSAYPGEYHASLDSNSTPHFKSNAELYFQYTVIKLPENLDDGIGFPSAELTCCLAVVWFLLFLSFLYGTKSTGKVAIFTVFFPPLVLLALLGRALCLEGAKIGIIYFFKPDWEVLLTFKVWRTALSQAFFSMAVGYGAMTYGSFNPFREGVKKDAIYIALTDVVYCLVAGVTVFSMLGELARRRGLGIEEIAQGDLGLAFVTYPEVLTYFGPPPWPQIFSFIFFAMLLSLGIGHCGAYIHPVLTALYEAFPCTGQTRKRKILVTACVCFGGFLTGLVFTAPGGLFIVHLIDHYLTGIILYTGLVCELIGIFWIYGVSNYIQDMEFMLLSKSSKLYKWWCYIIPLFMLSVAFYSFIELEEPVVNVNHRPVEFPPNILLAGYLFTVFSIVPIPAGALIVFCTRKTRSCNRKYMASVYPNPKWGPADPEDKRQWEIYKKSFHTKRREPSRTYQILIGQLMRRRQRLVEKDDAGTQSIEFEPTTAGGDSMTRSGSTTFLPPESTPSVVYNVQISTMAVTGNHHHDNSLRQYNEM